MELQLSGEVPGVTVGEGAIKVRSSVSEHYAQVTIERSEVAVCPEGHVLMAKFQYRSRSGRVEALTLFSGPTGVALELGGEGDLYTLHVFWESNFLTLEEREDHGLPQAAERFCFVFVPMAD
ncbi:hypothetical protein PUR61_13775 [Streptomyces sp. BE20]|uniref:hypothetical protein n=1 Tax=Streptomyces sp. BE20 TaxID=3002525 RepID=UPI002E7A4053|nr:hypothetical protein [Streptomyces sp. BE20]MEE1823250.1 hypothetical protein [Streptomyces sp. BE20]